MGIFSGIGSFVSSIAGTVGSMLGGVGSALFSGLSALGPALGTIGMVVSAVGAISGLFKSPEVDMEKLGAQMMAAQRLGIERGDFENYSDYMERVMELEVDTTKLTNEEKIASKALGTTATMLGINEKVNSEINIGTYEFLGNSTIDIAKITVSMLPLINKVIENYNITESKLKSYKNEDLVGIDNDNMKEALTEISNIVDIPASEILK